MINNNNKENNSAIVNVNKYKKTIISPFKKNNKYGLNDRTNLNNDTRVSLQNIDTNINNNNNSTNLPEDLNIMDCD